VTFLKDLHIVLRYREKAQYRSALLKDQPITPGKSAVWWVEYVIRHKGAPHLKSAVLDLNWFQKYLVDVIAFMVFLVLILLYLLLKLVNTCICYYAKEI